MRFILIVAVSLVGLWLLDREIRPRRREELDEDVLAQLRDHRETAPARRSPT